MTVTPLHLSNESESSHVSSKTICICRSRKSSRQVGETFKLGAKYPAIDWTLIDGTFNRTLSFRKDADATVQHGYWEPLANSSITELPPMPTLSARFKNYHKGNFNISRNKVKAPVVWFVSHCQSESGRDRYVRRLAQHIGVHVYGKCGDRKCGVRGAGCGVRVFKFEPGARKRELRNEPRSSELSPGPGHGSSAMSRGRGPGRGRGAGGRGGCGVRAAGCGVRGAGCGVRRAACGLRAAGCGVQN